MVAMRASAMNFFFCNSEGTLVLLQFHFGTLSSVTPAVVLLYTKKLKVIPVIFIPMNSYSTVIPVIVNLLTVIPVTVIPGTVVVTVCNMYI